MDMSATLLIRLVPPGLALASLLLSGCAGTTQGYTTEQAAYPAGQAVYPAQPAYPGQPVYQGEAVDAYGRPVDAYGRPVDPYGQPVMTSAPGYESDNYVYYPEADVYYSTTRGEYIYPDSGRWIRRREPPRVSAWGPSVQVWFHDSPERHHTEVIRSYPRHGWRRREYYYDRR